MRPSSRNNYAPWLSDKTKDLTKRRREAQSKAALTGDPGDLRLVKALRNLALSGGRKDREAWEREKLQSRGKSPAQIWAGVRAVLGWGNTGPPARLYHEGKYIDQPKGLATTYNNFTKSKIENLKKKIQQTNSDPVARLKDRMKNNLCEFKLKEVTVKEMEKMIRTLRPSSASGVDWIDTNCIKLAGVELAPALTHITNLSIKHGVFPRIYKESKVVPLKKATDLNDLDCNSYRPVNLLPQPGKIVERAVFIQLTEYLEANKLLHQNHHGGRKGHSTVTAMIQLYDKWVQLMEEGQLVGIMLIDQSAAFDLCDHEVLKKEDKDTMWRRGC